MKILTHDSFTTKNELWLDGIIWQTNWNVFVIHVREAELATKKHFNPSVIIRF